MLFSLRDFASGGGITLVVFFCSGCVHRAGARPTSSLSGELDMSRTEGVGYDLLELFIGGSRYRSLLVMYSGLIGNIFNV